MTACCSATRTRPASTGGRTAPRLFQGEAPGYLRRAYRDAGLPVDVPVKQNLLALVPGLPGFPLGAPIAAYEVTGEDDVVPVAVFAAGEGIPELHVDARYLAYAEARFNTASCWRVGHAIVTVRSPRGLVGIIEGRDLPPRGRHR